MKPETIEELKRLIAELRQECLAEHSRRLDSAAQALGWMDRMHNDLKDLQKLLTND